MKPRTHLFIDFENHQPLAEDFARLHGTEHRIWVFHGPHQNKFAVDLIAAWLPMAAFCLSFQPAWFLRIT